MDLQRNVVNYDEATEAVRTFCAERLYETEKALRPWATGMLGDMSPAILTGYLGVLKQLARLFEADKRPIDHQKLISVDKVEQLLEAQAAEHRRAMDLAVAEAEDRVRRELSSGQKTSIETAKATVMTRLLELEEKRRGA